MTINRKLNLKIIFIFLIVQIHSLHLCALEEYTKLWTSYEISGALSSDKKILFYLEPQLRFIDNAYKFEQVVLHGAIGYQFSNRTSILLGNSGIESKDSSGQFVAEYRVWEQLSWDVVRSKIVNAKSRTRLEQRKSENSPNWANRLREKLSLKIPLYYSQLSLILSDELFFNLNHPNWVSDLTLSQNRFFTGFDVKLSNKSSFEFGYLNQFQFNTIDQMSNVIVLEFLTKM